MHQDDCHHINRTVGAVVTIAAGSAADQMTRPRPSRCSSMTVAATRGVSGSRPRGASVKDGDDLSDLLETLALVPAHVVTSSWGGNIGPRLALSSG